MTDLSTALIDNRQSVRDFLAAAGAVPPAQWAQPRAPGKWSPAQVTEHVALAYELSRGILHGSFPGPVAPRFLRPLIRIVFLNPVLTRARFGAGGKSPKPFQPTESPDSAEALMARLQAAAGAFEADLATAAQSGQTTTDHPFFGQVPLREYLRLQVIHTHHHRRQLPSASTLQPDEGLIG